MASSSAAPLSPSSGGSWEAPFKIVSQHILTKLSDGNLISADSDAVKNQVLTSITESLNKLIPAHAETRLRALQTTNSNLQRENRNLTNDIENLKNKSARERGRLEAQIADLLANEKIWDDKMTELRQQHNSQLVKIDQENSGKDEEMATLKKEAQEYRKKTEAKEASDTDYVENLHTEIKTLQDKIDGMQEDINDSNQEVSRLQREYNDARLSLENHREILARFDDDVKEGDKLAEEFKALSQRHLNLQDEDTSRKYRIKELEDQMGERDHIIKALREEQAARADLPSGSEKGMGSPSSSISQAQIKQGSSLGEELEAAGRMQELEETIAGLRTEIETLQDQIKNPADVDALQTEIKKLRQQIKDLERTVEDRDKALDAVDIRNVELELALGPDFGTGAPTPAEVKEERDDLRKKLEEANKRVEELTKQSRDARALRDRVAALEKRERELQAQLKAKASSSPAKGDKAAPATGKAADVEKVEAALKQCEREKADLVGRIVQLNHELTQEQKEHQADLEASSSSDNDDEEKDNEIAALKKRVAELERQLVETLKAKGGDGAKRIADLERRLAQVTEDLQEEADARQRALARQRELEEQGVRTPMDATANNARIAEYEARIAQLQQSRIELADYFNTQMRETSANARRAIASHAEQVAAYQAEQDQAARQMDSANARIAANPGEAGSVARRRAAFLEAEIQKLVRRIQSLQSESRWFEDLARASQDAQERTEAALRDATAAVAARVNAAAGAAGEALGGGRDAMDRAIVEIARLRRERNGAGPGQAPRPAGRRGWLGGWGIPGMPDSGPGGWNVGTHLSPAMRRRLALLYQPIQTLVVVCMFVVHGREFAIFLNGNPDERRGTQANTPDRYAVCAPQPAWPILWEFAIMVLSGNWIWTSVRSRRPIMI
ncbi:hypothetical protein F4820DRAFT_471498 [Hypoxylon rubiginosum]|uniref:Uncharacterized protein n=1 Tax=Hypoxylon rubiginosum TaxID=110542 RepID=A0ACB9YW76_9PEZI|nr:hypothetical protein F4820DRAFT_471498 [Hypoxylon rubiginosum]